MIDLTHAAGKYGAYIWPAYGVSLTGFLAMTVDSVARSRRWRREADRRQKDSLPTKPTTGRGRGT